MDPFLGEIRLFACNYAPANWATCQGQLMAISQNAALFSLLGTTYGGDGRTTFALPNLVDRIQVGAGQGTGLSNYPPGTVAGTTSVTLTNQQMPAHTHTLPAGGNVTQPLAPSPTSYLAQPAGQGHSPGAALYVTGATQAGSSVTMASTMAGVAGSSQPHSNQSPYLSLNYCIALQGIFPQRP